MPVYTVHEPPQRDDDSEADPSRFVFVRDGFAFWAFLLAPLWMLRHRMWLVFIGFAVLTAAIGAGMHVARVPPGAQFAVGALLALLVGIEAGALRRWTLGRRGWVDHGVVVAEDLESAERRFFDAWGSGARPRYVVPAARAPSAPRDGRTPDVLGLFPEPGGRA